MSDQFLDVAIKAAQAGAKAAMKHFGHDLNYEVKDNPAQLVSIADKEAEVAIVKIISSAFPDHGILAEEGTSTNPDSPFLWSVDPIDGTLGFAHHLPLWCVSIGLLKDLKPITGVVLMPTGLYGKELLFTAVKNKGAYCNQKRIHVSSTKQLKKSFILWNYSPDDFQSSAKTIMHKLSPHISYANSFPSVAVALSLIANGNIPAYAHTHLEHWDVAAGALILEEAGGKCTSLTGKPINWQPHGQFDLLASNTHLHQQLLSKLSG